MIAGHLPAAVLWALAGVVLILIAASVLVAALVSLHEAADNVGALGLGGVAGSRVAGRGPGEQFGSGIGTSYWAQFSQAGSATAPPTGPVHG